MSKSEFRNPDTDAIDAQMGHDTRSGLRRNFETSAIALGNATLYVVRGVAKPAALTFAIAVGGATAIIAGNRLGAIDDATEVQMFMDKWGITGVTPEQFIQKLEESGFMAPPAEQEQEQEQQAPQPSINAAPTVEA